MKPTYTVAELAARYGLDQASVIRRCRGDRPWPHLRPNARKATTWRFTEADVEAIDDLMHHGGVLVDSWGREVRAS